MNIIKLIILPVINLIFMIIKKPSRLKKVIKNYPIAVANSQAGNLMADGKYQKALDKIDWLENKKLRGRIGLRKAEIYYQLKNHQTSINIAKQLIPYFKQTTYYNKYDQTYLLLTAKNRVFINYREMGVEQPDLLNELTHMMMEDLDLSKVDKSLMREFPMPHIKGWYKHNPKDEHYAEIIAKFGEE